MATIYRATNQINGKSYIGKTKGKLNLRINQHTFMVRKGSNTYFHNSIRKYGIAAFIFEIVEICNEDTINDRECYYINTLAPMYNLTIGGDGGNTWDKMDATKRDQRIQKLKDRELIGITARMQKGKHVTEVLSKELADQWKNNQQTANVQRSERRKAGNLTHKEREGYNKLREHWRSDKVRTQRSANAKGENNSNYKGPYYVDGKEYKFLRDIVKDYRVSGNYEQIKYYLARKNIALR